MHYLDKFKYCPACGSQSFAEHDFKSKQCKDCGFTYYFNSAAATVAIIENEKGEFLVARRACEPAKGTLDLIGGFVDPGESAEQAIVREIREETGIALEEKQVRLLFTLPNTYMFSNLLVHTCDSFFHVIIPSNTKIEAHDDISDCWWIEREKLNTTEIGLDSVRKGMERWLNDDKLNRFYQF